MPKFSLKLPPGIFRIGTVYESKGRWYDGSLVRWLNGSLRPVGPWMPFVRATDGDYPQVHLGAPALDARTFYDGVTVSEANARWLGAATEAGLRLVSIITPFQGGSLIDVTPSEMDDGTVYKGASIDTLGTDMVAVLRASDADTHTFPLPEGILIHVATADAAENSGEVVTEAPTAFSVFVTPEQFVVLLGARGDRRNLAWCDQGDVHTWFNPDDPEADVGQAGDYPLEGSGLLLTGRASRGESLVWTDTDLWSMRYVNSDFAYGFQRLGACTTAGEHAIAMVDGKSIWMGTNKFFVYDGFVRPLPCDVADLVFAKSGKGIRLQEQADDKSFNLRCGVNAAFNEVWWHYTSYDSTDGKNDRYVTYNYTTGEWAVGDLGRSAMVDAGVSTYPLWIDNEGGVLVHEVAPGTELTISDVVVSSASFDDAVPFAESGPIEIAEGDNVMHVTEIIPDGRTTADVQLTLFSSFYPTGDEVTNGPFSMENPTGVRVTGRQVRLRVEGATV